MSLWIGLGAFVIVAAVFLLLPLWRQKSALAGRQEIARWPVFSVLAGLSTVTVGLYLYLGAPGYSPSRR